MGPAESKLGFDILMGLGQRELQKSQVRAQNTINEANVYASNLMRSANNELAAKRGSLARFVQAENNNRVLSNMGSALEAGTVNYRRQSDNRRRQSLEQQIQNAEQAGAQAAAAATSGLTGGVVDAVAGTLALRQARIRQSEADTTQAVAFDQGRQQAAVLRSSLSAMDMNTIVDDIDFSRDVFVAARGPGVMEAILPALGNYAGNRTGNLKLPFNFSKPAAPRQSAWKLQHDPD
jgi:hypothetical protein